MTISQRMLHFAAWVMFERPWQSADYAKLQTQLSASGATLVATMRHTSDTPQNRDIVRHIIGIEAWAQQRLQSLINGPAYSAEYDHLQPAQTLTITELADIMASTRAQSIAIITQLQHAGIGLIQTIPHNQFGTMSVVAWARYITSHAVIEHKKLAK